MTADQRRHTGDRLQPALLDRLIDHAPEQASESLEARAISRSQLRAAVLRDLGWLFNATRAEPAAGSERHEAVALWDSLPLLRQSVLNFGLPAFVGCGLASLDLHGVERGVHEAIVRFEPRIEPESLVVSVTREHIDICHNTLQIVIRARIWGQPLPQELLLAADMDNGVLLTVSVTQLLEPDPALRREQAAALRARLHELQAQLGVRPPVYLLVTKIDLLAGFQESLGSLDREEREQVWGVSFPCDRQSDGGPVQAFAGEFAALEKRLRERLLERLQAEPDAARRAAIFAFPQQFAGLRGLLGAFLEAVFASGGKLEENALLRGVYFSSAQQQGTPIDRVLGALVRGFGVDERGPAPTPPGARPYFLGRLLREVVIVEQALVGMNRQVLVRGRCRALLGLSLLLVVGAALLSGWALEYRRNLAYLVQVKARLGTLRTAVDRMPVNRHGRQAERLGLSALFRPVAEFCSQTVAGRYPFASGARTDVLPADFGRLFRPGGLLDEFFQQHLADVVDTGSTPWRYKALADGSRPEGGAGLADFQRAARIRAAFFGQQGDQPAFSVKLRLLQIDPELDGLTLELGEQVLHFNRPGEEPQTVIWPDSKPASQMLLSANDKTLSFNGPWALFRLLQRFEVQASPQPERLTLLLDIDGHHAQLEVVSSSALNPLRLNELGRFRCPDQL